ncbi:hypothetical protein RhiirC2_714276 [Rhizophagus irregularis]|uniref:Uncharacterized protein n=1 Tax=Rhizophagus irregularis TaxID=588596 RepID=A0A2N1MZY7_9GLOM|nr:hypothetical protein RhiirC2_714276 [Rhizophagus irregularis]
MAGFRRLFNSLDTRDGSSFRAFDTLNSVDGHVPGRVLSRLMNSYLLSFSFFFKMVLLDFSGYWDFCFFLGDSPDLLNVDSAFLWLFEMWDFDECIIYLNSLFPS